MGKWQMICEIGTEQWHSEKWCVLRLLPSPPTACTGWENMACLTCSAKQTNVFALHVGFFYSAQLSHLLNSACVCSHSEGCNTETAAKETACAEKPVPSEWLLTSWVFKHSTWEHVQMQISHSTVSSVVRSLRGNNYILDRYCPGGMCRRSCALIL